MSQAAAIRDAMATALIGLLPGYTEIRRVAFRQLQPTDIPCATVIRGDEVMSADEDATAGPPHFVHETTIHVSLLRGFGDALALDGQIDADADVVLARLLRDPVLNLMFEGIDSVRRTRNFPQQGETYFVELRLEITVRYRSEWAPVIPDDFRSAVITVAPDNDTAAEVVTTTINLPQG